MAGDWRDLLLDRRFLVALVVLAVNDHLLKGWLGAGPLGLVTGKLSDMAAMVAGPVLVAALVAALVPALVAGLAGRRRALALVPPGLALGLLNLSAGAAAAYESTLEAVTGFEHRVVVDPTDLIGLVGLAMGWRIIDRPQPIARPRRAPLAGRRAVALLVGVVAVGLATASSSAGTDNRNRVLVEDGRVITGSSTGGAAWVSEDDGITWRFDAGAEPTDAEDARSATTELCLDAEPSVCVRLADGSTIEESDDGGQTWRRVWRVDGGSDRWLSSGQHGFDGSWSPIDLADMAETPSGAVVVAATTIDPLRRSPEGTWAPSIAELHTFQTFAFLPLVIAVAFMVIGLAAAGNDLLVDLGPRITAMVAALVGLMVLLLLVAGVFESVPRALALVGVVVALVAVVIITGGRGLLGLLGMLLAGVGALMALAYFVLLDVIGILVPMSIVPGLVALVLAVLVAWKGPGSRRVLGRNLLIGLAIVAVAAMPMALWSAGWGSWVTVNRVGASLAILGALALTALRVPVDRAAAEARVEPGADPATGR